MSNMHKYVSIYMWHVLINLACFHLLKVCPIGDPLVLMHSKIPMNVAQCKIKTLVKPCEINLCFFYNSTVDFLGVSIVNYMVLQCQRLDLPTGYSAKSAGFSSPLPDRWQLCRSFYSLLHFWKTLTALRA